MFFSSLNFTCRTYIDDFTFFFFLTLLFDYMSSLDTSGASQVALVVKNLLANTADSRDMNLIPGSGRSPGEGNGYLLQYSRLENPMDRGVW